MSKSIGTPYEQEVANLFDSRGYKSIRAPESDGRHLGEAAGVDVLGFVGDGQMLTVQCARRKTIAKYITQKGEDADVLCLRENYGETLWIMDTETFFSLVDDGARDKRKARALDKIIEQLTELRETYDSGSQVG